MNKKQTFEKVQVLYKRVSKESERGLTESECNHYISCLEDLKDELNDLGFDWIEDYEEIEEVSGGFFGGDASEEDIEEATEHLISQLEHILEKMGLDPDEVLNPKKENAPISVQVNPVFTQTQSQVTNILNNNQIFELLREFEKEISKSNPNKGRLQSITETLLNNWGVAVPVVEVFLKLIEKIQ